VANKTCDFCQEREAISKIEVGEGDALWTCGVCWDGFISDALSGIPASDTVEAGPNRAPAETENPLPEHR
jgi:hypothetical protein